MKTFLFTCISIAALVGISLWSCKKTPESCLNDCPFPRTCFTTECRCPDEMFYYANMCLHNINNKYIGLLSEGDFVDTFGLMVGKGMYDFTPQHNPYSGTGSSLSYYEFPTYDSLFIFNFPTGTGLTDADGWPPKLNGKKFLFHFSGTIKHENRDTLYAQLRWIGLGSGDDIRPPLNFKMHIPRKPQ